MVALLKYMEWRNHISGWALVRVWLVLGWSRNWVIGSVNLNILGLASSSIVLDAQGILRQLAPDEQPTSSDVVISFAENEESVPSVSAWFVDNQWQQSDLEINDAIAQVERAIEDGFDPTELGG